MVSDACVAGSPEALDACLADGVAAAFVFVVGGCLVVDFDIGLLDGAEQVGAVSQRPSPRGRFNVRLERVARREAKNLMLGRSASTI